MAVVLNSLAFLLLVVPATRKNWITLNIGCLATYFGVYIEKGMGLIIPGLTPDSLGEIYRYLFTATEFRVAAGVFSIGFLVFTLMLKVAVPITLGEFKHQPVGLAKGTDRHRNPTATQANQAMKLAELQLPPERG
jgi:Ni/Fe-hydrogenase subunit HybB-like protein